MVDRLRGSAETTVDDKGRFKVPSVFRGPLEELYGTAEFFVTSLSGGDVLVYPLPVWQEMEERLAKVPEMNPAKRKFLERVNTYGQVVKMDGQGRLLIPSLLREVSGLTGDTLLLGQTNHLQLVDRSRHLSALKQDKFTAEDYHELDRFLH